MAALVSNYYYAQRVRPDYAILVPGGPATCNSLALGFLQRDTSSSQLAIALATKAIVFQFLLLSRHQRRGVLFQIPFSSYMTACTPLLTCGVYGVWSR